MDIVVSSHGSFGVYYHTALLTTMVLCFSGYGILLPPLCQFLVVLQNVSLHVSPLPGSLPECLQLG